MSGIEKARETVDIFDTIGILGGREATKRFEMTKKLRITDIVKATGLSKSTLIRYEKEGKLPRAKRDGRKWRYYTEQDRDRIVETLTGLHLM